MPDLKTRSNAPDSGKPAQVIEPGDAATAKPRVEVVMVEGRVTEIRIQTNGADHIVLECD